MYATSSRFLQTARESHHGFVVVEVWEAGAPVRGWSGEALVLRPTSGHVSVDAGAPIRRSVDMTFAPEADDGTPLVPDERGGGVLGPYGTDFKVYRGFVYPTVNTETGEFLEVVPLGVFRLTKPNVVEDDQGATSVKCSGFDLSWLLQTPLVRPARVRAGTEVGEAFRRVIAAKAAFLEVDAPSTRFTVPSDVVIGIDADPWEEARKIARAAGCNAYCDVLGRIVMRPTSLRQVAPFVWDYNEDHESTQFFEPERSLDADKSPNAITVIGNSGGGTGTVRALAQDTDPSSPTFVGGRYGEQHKVYRSELVSTIEQAQAMADALLANSVGAHEQIRFRAACNPALAEWDPVRITRRSLGVEGRIAVIETMEIPLTTEADMDISTRRIPEQLFGLPDE